VLSRIVPIGYRNGGRLAETGPLAGYDARELAKVLKKTGFFSRVEAAAKFNRGIICAQEAACAPNENPCQLGRLKSISATFRDCLGW
jgi:hypothetical protein